MTRFRHILVPIDFEATSKRALQVAIDLALTFDAKLTVVHAWELPGFAYTAVDAWGDVCSPLEDAAKRQLSETMAEVHKRFPQATSTLLRGAASDEILSAIGRENIDLVIMGTHGRRGLNRVLLGSVAGKVVRASTVPVLTIGSREES